MSISLDREYLKGYVSDADIARIKSRIKKVHDDLENKTGAGHEFTGWMDLPHRIENSFIAELEKLGEEVRGYSDCLVSIGIGGSYLGIRATIEYLRGAKLPVYYIGHNMSVDNLHKILEKIKNKRVTVAVISKSGTTTEPALAFRIIKKLMAEKYSGANRVGGTNPISPPVGAAVD